MQEIQWVGAYLPHSTTGTTKLVPGILNTYNWTSLKHIHCKIISIQLNELKLINILRYWSMSCDQAHYKLSQMRSI